MPSLATDSFYLFREDGLDGPYSPVQLRLMLDSGQIGKDIYCQPQNGGSTRVLREIFEDPESFQSTRSRPTSPDLDPYASGDVPLMGDTLPLQSGVRDCSHFALKDSPPNSSTSNSRYRAAHHPRHDPSSLILDATHTDTPFEREFAEPEANYHGHPSYLSYTRSVAVILIAAIAGTLALPLVGTIATVSGFGIAFLILVGIWADRSFTDYVVTNRRVEVITGVISRSSNEVKICDIRSINVLKAGLLGFLGIGTVEFASSGGDEVEIRFKNIRGAHKLKHLVRQLQDA